MNPTSSGWKTSEFAATIATQLVNLAVVAMVLRWGPEGDVQTKLTMIAGLIALVGGNTAATMMYTRSREKVKREAMMTGNVAQQQTMRGPWN